MDHETNWDGVERRNADISHTSMTLPQVATLIVTLLTILGSIIGLYINNISNSVKMEFQITAISKQLDEIASTVKSQQSRISELDSTLTQLYVKRDR